MWSVQKKLYFCHFYGETVKFGLILTHLSLREQENIICGANVSQHYHCVKSFILLRIPCKLDLCVGLVKTAKYWRFNCQNSESIIQTWDSFSLIKWHTWGWLPKNNRKFAKNKRNSIIDIAAGMLTTNLWSDINSDT